MATFSIVKPKWIYALIQLNTFSKKKLLSKSGTEWNYSGGNTQLLAEIIQRMSGLKIDEFANKFLFLPLGIHQYEWINLS